MGKPNFALVRERALNAAENVLQHWLPGGSRKGSEYVARNPKRADKSVGSFSVNISTGLWAEFATGDKGGDLISLVAYLEGIKNGEACERLARYLGISSEQNFPQNLAPQVEKKRAPKAKNPIEAILPVPGHALSKIPERHPHRGEPSLSWDYRDSQGTLLFRICRFNKAGSTGKDFCPLTYCRLSQEPFSESWRWKLPIDLRPLYGLDRLAERPNAPVMICEGEKSADAATLLLPGWVCVCWPSGSAAVRKADFTPLRGRDATIWPDNDVAGEKCTKSLIKIFRDLGVSSLGRLNLDFLGALPGVEENGTAVLRAGESWPTGADAADCTEAGWSSAHMTLFLERQNSITQLNLNPVGSEVQASGGDQSSVYQVTDAGVFITKINDAGKRWQERISDSLHVLAWCRDAEQENWGKLVRFADPDGVVKQWNIPARSLTTESGVEVTSILQSLGFRLVGTRRRDFIAYLLQEDPVARVQTVQRLGWHGASFLRPDGEVLGGERGSLYFEARGSNIPDMKISGTSEEWIENVGKYCRGNHLLMLAVSSAFASSLVNITGLGSGGFHFFGDSS